MHVIAVPVILTLALMLLPDDFLYSLPTTIQYLFRSSIASAAIVAILMN